jgi:co-chaperonin GroES (HSP10)
MGKVMKIVGARVLVEDIITELDLVERGKLSNLTVVTSEASQPKPTTGLVIAVGGDPMIAEYDIYIGSIVGFRWTSGIYQYVEGKQYRSLELQEIITVTNEEKV